MSFFNWRKCFNKISRTFQGRTAPNGRAARERLRLSARPRLEYLEDRLAPALGIFSFQLANDSVLENTGGATLHILLTATGALSTNLSVDVSDLGIGTANNGTDYTFASPLTVTFTPAEVTSAGTFVKNMPVTVNPDSLVEADETTTFGLSNQNQTSGTDIAVL